MNQNVTAYKLPFKPSPAAYTIIRDADNCKIAQLGNSRMDKAEHEALRDFIIRACNQHHARAVLLESLLHSMENWRKNWNVPQQFSTADIDHRIDEVRAELSGGKPMNDIFPAQSGNANGGRTTEQK